MNEGYIKISRAIRDWKWYNDPLACALWMHILIEANWKDGYWGKQNFIKVPRGSFITSLVQLSKQMKCNRQTVRRWLDAFERDEMVTCEYTSKYTKITVIKYDFFQTSNNLSEQVNKQVVSTKLASSEHVVSTIEERKNSKKNKNTKKKESIKKEKVPEAPHTRFSKPALQEVEDYISENLFVVDAGRFYDYYESNGWKVGKGGMKDWKACVRNWNRKEQENKNRKLPNTLDDLPF